MRAEIVVVTYDSHDKTNVETRTLIARATEHPNLRRTYVGNGQERSDTPLLTPLVTEVLGAETRLILRKETDGANMPDPACAYRAFRSIPATHTVRRMRVMAWDRCGT
jgi:hypothetical protein